MATYNVGDFVKAKINDRWQLAVDLKSRRNKSYVMTGVEPETYSEIDTLAGESRWVLTTDMKVNKK